MQEELITEMEAARRLGVSPARLRFLASQGFLQTVPLHGSQEYAALYYTSEVLKLKERLRVGEGNAGTDEWPEFIDQ